LWTKDLQDLGEDVQAVLPGMDGGEPAGGAVVAAPVEMAFETATVSGEHRRVELTQEQVHAALEQMHEFVGETGELL
jgi:hypothetical protein